MSSNWYTKFSHFAVGQHVTCVDDGNDYEVAGLNHYVTQASDSYYIYFRRLGNSPVYDSVLTDAYLDGVLVKSWPMPWTHADQMQCVLESMGLAHDLPKNLVCSCGRRYRWKEALS